MPPSSGTGDPTGAVAVKLLNLLRRRVHDREMDDEMRFHIEMEAADLERGGLTAAEARRRALARFGGVRPSGEVEVFTWAR